MAEVTGSGEVACAGARDEDPTPMQMGGGPGRPARAGGGQTKRTTAPLSPCPGTTLYRVGKSPQKLGLPQRPRHYQWSKVTHPLDKTSQEP